MKLYNYKSQVIMEIEANPPIVFCIGLICFFKSTEEGVKDNTNEVVVSRNMHQEVKSLTQYMQSIFYTNLCIMNCYLLFV